MAQNWKKYLAICGIVSPIIFAVMVIIESLLRPGYSQTFNFISDLGVGSNAILQDINFWIFGILTLGFVVGLWQSTPAKKSLALKAGIVLVAIFAIGVGLAGFFPEDYGDGHLHTLVSSTAFVAIIAALLLVWWGLRKADKTVWGNYRLYTLASGLLDLILLFVFNASMGGDYQGLVQRLFLAVPMLWILVTGLKL